MVVTGVVRGCGWASRATQGGGDGVGGRVGGRRGVCASFGVVWCGVV